MFNFLIWINMGSVSQAAAVQLQARTGIANGESKERTGKTDYMKSLLTYIYTNWSYLCTCVKIQERKGGKSIHSFISPPDGPRSSKHSTPWSSLYYSHTFCYHGELYFASWITFYKNTLGLIHEMLVNLWVNLHIKYLCAKNLLWIHEHCIKLGFDRRHVCMFMNANEL